MPEWFPAFIDLMILAAKFVVAFALIFHGYERLMRWLAKKLL